MNTIQAAWEAAAVAAETWGPEHGACEQRYLRAPEHNRTIECVYPDTPPG